MNLPFGLFLQTLESQIVEREVAQDTIKTRIAAQTAKLVQLANGIMTVRCMIAPCIIFSISC
jgi:hypothetical protein